MANNPGGEFQFNKATGQQEWVPYFENRAANGGGPYTVQPGDSYESIAAKLFGNERMFADLMKANGGAYLHPGMQLDVPQNVQNPFVSNELAAALGMATSGQVASAYQGGDLNYKGGMNWTPQQATTNQQWAYDAARGNAQGLQYGNLPTGYVSPTVQASGLNPVIQNQTVAPRGHSTADTTRRNAQQTTPTVAPTPAPQAFDTRGQDVAARNQAPAPFSNLFTPLNQAAQGFIDALTGGNTQQPVGGPFRNGRLFGSTAQPVGGPFQNGRLGAVNAAILGPLALFNSIFNNGDKTTPAITNMTSGTTTPIEPPTADTVTSATQQTASTTTPAEVAATQTGWDWMSIRAGLAVQPPAWYYPQYNYSGGGGGGGSSGSMSSGYYGLVNLRLSTG
jgi:hypothetical protein